MRRNSQEIVLLFHCITGGVRLLGDDCSQCCKHCAINGPCVIEEGADNFLDNVFVIFVLKGWWSLLLRRIAPLIHSEALHVGMVGLEVAAATCDGNA